MKYTMMNGQLTELKQAAIPVMDHGFLYGIGLFETFRTYQGKPSNLGRHLDRMAAGCAELGIPLQLIRKSLSDGLSNCWLRMGWRKLIFGILSLQERSCSDFHLTIILSRIILYLLNPCLP